MIRFLLIVWWQGTPIAVDVSPGGGVSVATGTPYHLAMGTLSGVVKNGFLLRISIV
jgi:hypothetical protein